MSHRVAMRSRPMANMIIGGIEQKAHFFVMVAIESAIGPSDNGDAAQ